MWDVQIYTSRIYKTPCKPTRNLAKIQMSQKSHPAPPGVICHTYNECSALTPIRPFLYMMRLKLLSNHLSYPLPCNNDLPNMSNNVWSRSPSWIGSSIKITSLDTQKGHPIGLHEAIHNPYLEHCYATFIVHCSCIAVTCSGRISISAAYYCIAVLQGSEFEVQYVALSCSR